ncbi:uncharacterized protein LOC120129467 [Hibiscus syriacus]|uniref:uncharacterized protein LOC120129467 n=1 Tax=Hibiscus syriacus TaxID=106335 RepID=UPI0019208788|nr:uncharacterized protein LOC120129467 [Hibiscus syriacus]
MASPSKVGPAISTEVYLNNQTDEDLSTFDKKDWYGTGNQPLNVPSHQTRYFQHLADSNVGSSIAGSVFVIKQNIKWVVAWRNGNNEDNKVYTEITTDSPINWDNINAQLKKATNHAEASKLGFKSTLDIDPTSNKPNLNAKLEEA